MRETVNISLPPSTKRELDQFTKKQSLNRSNVLKEAIRQYLIREQFRQLRMSMLLQAQQRGIYTDQEVFRKVS